MQRIFQYSIRKWHVLVSGRDLPDIREKGTLQVGSVHKGTEEQALTSLACFSKPASW